MSTLLKTFITRTSSDLPRESSEMFISFRARAGGGVTPVYGLYRYVRPQKGMALNCFGQKG